jgi:hypothetical protein
MVVVHELLVRKRDSRMKPALSEMIAVAQPIAASVWLRKARGSWRSLSFGSVHQHGVVQDGRGAGGMFADATSKPSAEPQLPLLTGIMFVGASARQVQDHECACSQRHRGPVASLKPSLPHAIKVSFSIPLCVCLGIHVKGALTSIAPLGVCVSHHQEGGAKEARH